MIGGVKTLLHDQGMTIRGVQKLFREEGIKHVSGFSAKLDGEDSEEAVEDQALVIDRDAIPATPAPAARSSRNATPDPIADDVVASSGGEAAPPEPVFTHKRATPVPTPTETATPPVAKPEPLPEPELEPEPSETSPEPVAETAETGIDEPGPTIPDTPDVPMIDPEDDAPEFAATPGIAARLLMTDRAVLEAHRADVVQAAERLKALLTTSQ